jgi:hypothetical protein
MACTVGYFVEAVACAEHFQLALRFDKLPDLLKRVGGVQTFGAVFKIARPVFQFRTGPAIIAERILMKLLLSMAKVNDRNYAVGTYGSGRMTATILHLFLRSVENNAPTR